MYTDRTSTVCDRITLNQPKPKHILLLTRTFLQWYVDLNAHDYVTLSQYASQVESLKYVRQVNQLENSVKV